MADSRPVVVLISADPRASHRANEAMRIGLGVVAGENQVTFVLLGPAVHLLDEDTDEKVKYRIVGEIEASVKQGRISITSPLARALLGKRKKDVVEVSTPGGGKSYKVLKVEYK